MRIALYFFVLATLAGCSTIQSGIGSIREAWSWDVTQLQPRLVLSAPELADLNTRIAQLRQERNDIRARVSAEPTLEGRQRLYVELHDLGMRLSPLERRLASTIGRTS